MDVRIAADRIDDYAEGILSLWERYGALTGEAARQRLAEVLCVLVDDDGAVVGVNSAVDTEIAFIGGRRFWFYRRFVEPAVGSDWDAPMLSTAFDVLARRFEAAGGALGLCVVSDPETGRRHPEAVWPATQLLYAGTLPDGRHIRIRYFEGAKIA